MEQQEIDIELQQAQEALARAQKRKGEAEATALAQVRAQIAAQEADTQRTIERERLEREERKRLAYEAMARKAHEKRLEVAAQKAKEQQLQRELSEREQSIKAEAERQESVRKIQEQAFAVEQEARQIESDLIRSKTPRVEPKPVTIHDPSHPLSRWFGVEQSVTQEPVAIPVEVAKSTLREVGFEEAGKLFDYIILQAGVRVDRTEIVNMLSRFPYETVENVFTTVLTQHKAKKMSGSDITFAMQALLLGRA